MNAMVPVPYRVIERRVETADTVTLRLAPCAGPPLMFAPGQFTMMYAFGIGEVPISISGGFPGGLDQTIRSVGAVSAALCASRPGTVIGLRGPYGTGWGLPGGIGDGVPYGTLTDLPEGAEGADLMFLAGGIGLAPLRPAITTALADLRRYGRTSVLIGTRTPADLLFRDELAEWRAAGAQVEVTVDRPAPGWHGEVGLVTRLIEKARFDPARTVAYVCGPEVMMRAGARDLLAHGIPPARIRVSLERNMHCGVALCGHCQLGPLLLCRDGPVVGYDRVAPALEVREL